MLSVRIYPFAGVDANLLGEVASSLAEEFGIEVESGDTLPVPDSYSRRRGQFRSKAFLEALKARRAGFPGQAGKRAPLIVGITDLDLFVPELNFIFGQADTENGVAVVSIARLNAEHYSRDPDLELLKERTVKEVTHEIGHIFGLSHCMKPECIMFFSANVAETDQKGPGFCAACNLWLRSEIDAAPRG